MTKEEWESLLLTWVTSGTVQRVDDEKEINALIQLLKHFNEDRDGKIAFFNADPDKVLLNETDGIQKWEILPLAAEQLVVHRTVWRTHLDKNPKFEMRAYEFPFCPGKQPPPRYLKIEFHNKSNALYSPSKVPGVKLSYHVDRKAK